MLTSCLLALPKTSRESSPWRCSRKNRMVTGTNINMMPPHAAAVHPKAMLARYPAAGPLITTQACWMNWRIAVRRPEPDVAWAVFDHVAAHRSAGDHHKDVDHDRDEQQVAVFVGC